MLVTPAQAVELLRQGQLVAIPTETVYGLAADATQPEAIARVFACKGRPNDHPLIVHLGQPDWAQQWGQLPPLFEGLVKAFWPGPLTLVVPRQPGVPDCITGGQDTVALRMPRHPLTLEILKGLGRPLVAPSANRFGHTSPTQAHHVEDEFQGQVAVVDGGSCPVGLESTILDLSGELPRLLRPGLVSRQQLQNCIGPLGQADERAPRVPGALDRHYAPRTPTRWATSDPPQGSWGWLGWTPQPQATRQNLLPPDPEGSSERLYASLRELDGAGLDLIVVEPPPQRSGLWEALHDRLNRAVHEAAPKP